MHSDSSNYQINYLDSVIEEDIPSLPKKMKNMILKAIETRIMKNPVAGKPLRHSFAGHFRVRVGDYRIVYKGDPKKKTVLITIIKHRKDVYDE